MMDHLYQKIKSKSESISLVGLGYVGMPIAIEFAKRGVNVIGFDLNKTKIDIYKSGIDPTHEVGDDVIQNSSVYFTADEKDLQKAKFQCTLKDVFTKQKTMPRTERHLSVLF